MRSPGVFECAGALSYLHWEWLRLRWRSARRAALWPKRSRPPKRSSSALGARMPSRDDQSGLLDVYEGALDDFGALVVSNVGPGMHYVCGGARYHNRMRFSPIADGCGRWRSVETMASPGAPKCAWSRATELSQLQGGSAVFEIRSRR